MSTPGGTTPIVYDDDVEIQNGSNGGEGSGQIILQVVQPNSVEESGMLVPQVAFQAIPTQPTMPKQPIQVFDGSRIFERAPQYHWHAPVAKGAAAVD